MKILDCFTVDSIPGWFDFQDLYQSRVTEAHSEEPSTFIEIGTCFGRSACFMGDTIKRSGKPIKFHTIDPFDESKLDESVSNHLVYTRECLKKPNISMEALARLFIRSCGMDDYVNVIKGRSADVASTFYNDSVDFIFIDGSHDYEDVKADIVAWWHKLKALRVLAGHDFALSGVNRAVTETIQNHTVRQQGGCWVVFKAYHTP
jgi:predicted O-methyltransferase YrrM